jgi:peptide chain release factor 2
MSEGSFWNDQAAAQTVIAEANRLKNIVNPSSAFRGEMDDLKAMLELVDEMGEDPESEALSTRNHRHTGALATEDRPA